VQVDNLATGIEAQKGDSMKSVKTKEQTPKKTEQITQKQLKFLTTFGVGKMCAVADGAAFGPVTK
jgi:hypothetical protein